MFDKKEEIYYAVIITSVFVFVLIGIIIYALLLYLKRKRNHLVDKAVFKQTLLSSQLEIREQTLRYIGKELHDNLGQVASLIKINLNTLQLTDLQKATEKIENTKDLTRQLIADIKSLSVSLGGDRIIQKGLIKAVEIEVDRLNKIGQFVASFSVQDAIPFIDNDTSVILFRMVQEVLNNMVKHSNAKHIDVTAGITGNLFILALNDDGDGFEIKEEMNSGGAGLQNLYNRAGLIKAQLGINSTLNKGTHISIALPL